MTTNFIVIGKNLNIRQATHEPVSYTHLDVYKRQLRDDWNTNCIRLAMYTAEDGGYCSGGDVYKRQMQESLVLNFRHISSKKMIYPKGEQ